MSSSDAKPVEITVTKLTIPENLAGIFIEFMPIMQVYRYGREFDEWITGLLGYWITGLLGYWITGLLDNWVTG